MKIVHIIMGLHEGGAEAALTRLVLADGGANHEVISLIGAGKNASTLRAGGVRLHLLNFRTVWGAVWGIPEIIRILRRSKPDVVQCWAYHANLIGTLACLAVGHRRVVWNLRTVPNPANPLPTRMIRKIAALLSSWLPSSIICCAEEVANSHAKVGYSRQRMVVIPNGIEDEYLALDAASRTAFRCELGIGENEWIIGRVARDAPQKDNPTLFRSLKAIEQKGIRARCLLVGWGMTKDNEQLVQLARSEQVEHLLILAGPRSEVRSVYHAIDLALSSSMAEGFPNVLCEAMAGGVPVVATDAGGSAEVVAGAGWIAPVGDAEAIALAVEQAYRECHHATDAWAGRKLLGQRSVQARFSLGAMVAAYRREWVKAARRSLPSRDGRLLNA